MLIGLGVFMLAHNVLPTSLHHGSVHAGLILAAIAAAFGALYAFGNVGRRFFKVAAVFFGAIAVVAWFASAPWQWVGFSLGMPFWAVVVILGGLYLMRR